MHAAGGVVGFLASSPLASALTSWVGAPLLALVAGFGVLVITATPVNQVPARLLHLRDVLLRRKPAPSRSPHPRSPSLACAGPSRRSGRRSRNPKRTSSGRPATAARPGAR